MSQIVSKLSMAAWGIAITVALLAGVLTTGVLAEGGVIEMVVSPSTLNLGSKGGVISIHADIAYASVTGVSVAVNGTPIPHLYTFADSRGDLVIKCSLELVKGLVSTGTATFQASIFTDAGEWSGEDVIPVISCPK